MKTVNNSIKTTIVATCAFMSAMCVNAGLQTIGFDDWEGGPIANGYSGLNWDNFSVLDGVNHTASGYQNGVTSTNNVAYNSSAQTATISSYNGIVFGLVSANITGAWRDGLNVEVIGYLGKKQVYDVVYVVDSTEPSFIKFPLQAVTKVEFMTYGGVENESYSGSGAHMALDDLKVVKARVFPAIPQITR